MAREPGLSSADVAITSNRHLCQRRVHVEHTAKCMTGSIRGGPSFRLVNPDAIWAQWPAMLEQLKMAPLRRGREAVAFGGRTPSMRWGPVVRDLSESTIATTQLQPLGSSQSSYKNRRMPTSVIGRASSYLSWECRPSFSFRSATMFAVNCTTQSLQDTRHGTTRPGSPESECRPFQLCSSGTD
jgi:hypothetical protein